MCWAGAAGDYNILRLQCQRTFFGFQLDGVWANKFCVAFKDGDVITPKLCADHLDFARDHALDANRDVLD